jgi:hypothetical protein
MDATVLVQMAEVFLGDGDLMSEFRELVGLDDRTGGAENVPPGSIRVGPPDAMSAMPADDGEGPSYRRLPDSVSCFPQMIAGVLRKVLLNRIEHLHAPVVTNSVGPFLTTSGCHTRRGQLRKLALSRTRKTLSRRFFINARKNATNTTFNSKH